MAGSQVAKVARRSSARRESSLASTSIRYDFQESIHLACQHKKETSEENSRHFPSHLLAHSAAASILPAGHRSKIERHRCNIYYMYNPLKNK